jgi:hypothetical protein
MLNVFMLSVVMLSVVAPAHCMKLQAFIENSRLGSNKSSLFTKFFLLNFTNLTNKLDCLMQPYVMFAGKAEGSTLNTPLR